jgi:hypothetical protein
LALLATRFLNGSAKVRACIFLPNFFSILFELFGVKINLFCEELRFFKSGLQRYDLPHYQQSFPSSFIHTHHTVYSQFRELIAAFLQAGSKGRYPQLPTKSFFKNKS